MNIFFSNINKINKLYYFTEVGNAKRIKLVSSGGDDKYFMIACSRYFPPRHW